MRCRRALDLCDFGLHVACYVQPLLINKRRLSAEVAHIALMWTNTFSFVENAKSQSIFSSVLAAFIKLGYLNATSCDDTPK